MAKRKANRQGSIRKTSSKRYQVRVTHGVDEYGRQRQGAVPGLPTFATKAEAQRALNQYLADRERGLVTAPNQLTLAALLQRWLAAKTLGAKPKTAAN